MPTAQINYLDYKDFARKSEWRKSKANPDNRWRYFGPYKVVLFLRNTRFGILHQWVIADSTGPTFSDELFTSRKSAMKAAWNHLQENM